MEKMHRLYDNVVVGRNVTILDFAIIGMPLDPSAGPATPTIIGDDSVIGSHAVIYEGVKLGKGFRCGHRTTIGPDAEIGDNCSVGQNSVVEYSRIGDNTVVHNFVHLGVMPSDKYDYKNAGRDFEPLCKIGPDSIIRSHSNIYAKTEFGERLHVGHGARVRECIRAGKKVLIGTNVTMEGFSELGDNVVMLTNSHLTSFAKMKDRSYITVGAVTSNTPHPLCPQARQCLIGPTIEEDVKIAMNAFIGPGVTVGRNSLIGAGAVVVKDVPEGVVVVGNPLRILKKVEEVTCRFGRRMGPYVEE
jgi:serine O-acetyltransferase